MRKQTPRRYVLGIDLGTTYSSVGVFTGNEVEILSDNFKEKSIPSVVTFTENSEIHAGTLAKEEAVRNLDSTVYDSKRMIGHKYSDEVIQKGIKTWPFKVIRGCEDIPKIQCRYDRFRKQFLPEEISSFILKELKSIADDFYSADIREAIITVPADFNTQQRLLTYKAGELAGLKVLRVVDEPTAAAIAYGMNENVENKRTILVFDFGGGTLDVSLLEANKDKIYNDEQVLGCKVIATSGDSNLGGQDFDNNLLNYLAEKFKEINHCDFREDRRARLVMKNKCEVAKKTLSNKKNATILVPGLYNGLDFQYEIPPEVFDEINSNLFDRILAPVKKVIDFAKIPKSSIEYILVGGSSRLPTVQKILRDFFDGRGPSRFKNPNIGLEYAVVYGAAYVGYDMTNSSHSIIRIESTLPHSLGVEVHGGKMEKILHQNCPIPTRKVDEYTTASDYQKEVRVKIYSGESEIASENSYLGDIVLSGITIAEKSKPVIEITFEVTHEGILKVYTKDKKTNAQKDVEVKYT
ncbi:cytoplasmic heat shock protein 70 [Histomonas meleagridis]|uniref:cytoplasmic heat shock protein 70 n=1 Tax=Histomonas meleagridis TaxID=135588 RepID=UPI0035595441|nr:cytoplasmic heat shock protein 70 [Histomonas meleagridis]KAH0798267.1 cytoplasmic heat shock protein 70 [Histomonas meleagridis]